MPTFQNVQGEGNWTGIEYASAAMMIDQGMVDQGVNVVKAVNQRYLRAGRFFNHEECGPHYYRPMSIWATFLAASGFKVDAPRETLTIASPINTAELTSPWVSATGLGTYIRKTPNFEMHCAAGQTAFRTLRINVPGVRAAELDGNAIQCNVRTQDALSIIEFASPVELSPGRVLIIH
jgi:hypothetical protein